MKTLKQHIFLQFPYKNKNFLVNYNRYKHSVQALRYAAAWHKDVLNTVSDDG